MKRILFCIAASVLLFACKKEEVGTLEINHNGPIVAGWDLNLSTISTQEYRIWWYGPNGWKVEPQTISNQSNYVTRTPVSLQDAGEYIVRWVDNDGKIK